jgi:GT2 family glycosyltransferase
MNVTYLMISFNRREGLLANIAAVYGTDPRADVWVVDNASSDGTADAVREAWPRVRLIQLDRNVGMPARNVALRQMKSEYCVLLDDDSHPLGDAVEQSVDHMNRHPRTAAVVGCVLLPNGVVEAPAMPGVLMGGASCVRVRALRDVGFFPHDFFRQAEEYDLSARLWNAGYRIERYEDVRYRHNKRPAPGRVSRDVVSLDLKHNLIVAARHLPEPFDRLYSEDFAFRYRAIMTSAGHAEEYERVVADAHEYIRDDDRLARAPMGLPAFENLFEHQRQYEKVSGWSAHERARCVAIADVSKNLYATFQACQRAGLRIAAIIDDREMFVGESYRNVPILATELALAVPGLDGVVVSNTNPAQIDRVAGSIHAVTSLPMLKLWTPRTLREAIAEAA